MKSQPLNETEVEVVTTEKETPVAVVTPPAKEVVVVPPVAPAKPVPPPVDYREKFGSSTRENQVLQGELEELGKQLGEITSEEIPSDEDMVKMYPEYEFAEPIVQSILKRQEVQDRRMNSTKLGVNKLLGSVTRRNELARIVSTNPALAGKETKFLDFAADSKRVNVPVETLVSAFLFEIKDDIAPVEVPVVVEAKETVVVPPAKEETPASPLERGTPHGGFTPEVPTKKEMTPEEMKSLRISNPKKYNELVRRGEI